MQIIIKTDLTSKVDTVLNILYGENDIYTQSWIKNYLNNEIELPENKDKDLSIHESEDNYYLVKTSKIISKGYIYNTHKSSKENLYLIKYINFDKTTPIIEQLKTQNNSFWNNINSEINHNIMKHIDHASLYEINLKFDSIIKTKPLWNSTELVMLQNEITKNYKKELYSSIVKKMKKFEKKTQFKKQKAIQGTLKLPCKTLMINENGELYGCGNGLPDLNKFVDQTEFTIINSKN